MLRRWREGVMHTRQHWLLLESFTPAGDAYLEPATVPSIPLNSQRPATVASSNVRRRSHRAHSMFPLVGVVAVEGIPLALVEVPQSDSALTQLPQPSWI